jgi:FAD/FMN-containing dehydrogenase
MTTTYATKNIPQIAIAELRAAFAGELIAPDDAAYAEARLVWNGMIDRRPGLIARVANVQDVVAAVNVARQHNLPVAVRGGGHNVAGLGTLDGGLVIDLQRLHQVTVDPATRRVKVGGGATLGQMDAATQQYGLAVPAGVVTDTGIGGLALGGGLGWLRSKFGLTADNLLAAQVVTADGRVLHASPDENADLLWGLRGGGGNFGIVTEFEFQAHPVGPQVAFTFVFHDGARMQEGLRFFRDYIARAPEEVSAIAFAGIFPPGAEIFPEEIQGEHFLAFGAMYAGPVEAGERVMAPLREWASPRADFSDRMPYLQAQQMFDEDYPKYELRYYWKSLNLMELSDAAIERFVEYARRQPSPYSTTDLWPVRGAVKRYDSEHGAFFGRQAAFLLNPEANWIAAEDDQANLAWVRGFVAAMGEFSDGSRYLNFAGFQEEGDEMMRQAYGPHYRRLVELKHKYDPDNFFSRNQNIQPREQEG